MRTLRSLRWKMLKEKRYVPEPVKVNKFINMYKQEIEKLRNDKSE